MYLESIVLQNNLLKLIKDHRILLYKHHNTSMKDKVKILSGGPAGMAPLHSGFVGPGMLTAAVYGEMNTCPSLFNILAALKILSETNNAGTLVIVTSSLSQRLSFGMACRQAALEHNMIMLIVVGEDCVGEEPNKIAGRKGLSGILFLQKIAGAMAEESRTLFEIYYVLISLNRGSLASLNQQIHCNNPELNPIQQCVSEAFYYLFEPYAQYSLHIDSKDQIALMINNMGISELYMGFVIREVYIQIETKNIHVQRVYIGRFSSSSDANMFSISVLKVNDRLLKWLDFPVNVLGWPNNSSLCTPLVPLKKRCLSFADLNLPCSEHNIFDKINLGPKFSLSEAKEVVKVLRKIVTHISDVKHFSKLHSDIGTSFRKFMTSIKNDLDFRSLIIVTPYALLNHLAELATKTMTGVEGPIFSVLLYAAAQVYFLR